MKIPPLRRLDASDYSSQLSWISPLLNALNLFMEQTITALNNRLTITDNFSGTFLTVTLDGNFPLNLAWSLPSRPISVVVGNCYRTDGTPFTLSSAVQVQWTYNQKGQLEIDGVVGITPSNSTKYTIILQCMTG